MSTTGPWTADVEVEDGCIVIIEGSRKQVIKYSCSNTIDKVSFAMPVLLSHCAACDAAHRRLLRRSKQVWPNPISSCLPNQMNHYFVASPTLNSPSL
jgi:hypothetical protein